MLTTALIVVPFAAALFLWLVPLPREYAGPFAILAAVVEVGIWIRAAIRFDFSGGLQFSARHNWFADLGVSYHVGFYGFSLWLAGTRSSCARARSATAFGHSASTRGRTSA